MSACQIDFLRVAASSNYVIIPILQGTAPYRMIPVTVLCISQLVLAINPRVAANNVQELINLAKSQPGKLSFASAGVGTTPYMAGELFKLNIRQDIVHIPYKGAGPSITALVGGQVPMAFTSVSAVVPFIQDGRLRALATTGEKRTSALPNVPTFVEAGFPDVVVDQWNAIFVPSSTPGVVSLFVSPAISHANL